MSKLQMLTALDTRSRNDAFVQAIKAEHIYKMPQHKADHCVATEAMNSSSYVGSLLTIQNFLGGRDIVWRVVVQ